MTEKIEGKNGNQWQFISDENDIETIMKKLDWIANVLYESTMMIEMKQVEEYRKLFGKKDESKK